MIDCRVWSIGASALLWCGACASADAGGESAAASAEPPSTNGSGSGASQPSVLPPAAPSGELPIAPPVNAAGGASGSPGVEGNGGAVSLVGAAGSDGLAGGAASGSAGASMTGPVASNPGDCTSLPATNDYAAPGPFADARMFANVGPNGNYTLFRPEASLGQNGFRHPIATWGNGILTTPDQYAETLTLIASHGFFVIACNDTQAERPCLSAGLDWLIEQDAAAGEFAGRLDTTREVTVGYSWGGGAAIDTADRPNVKATVSMHGMPPRGAAAFDDMHSPLLLFTSTGDTFVSADGYVTPNYEKSQVLTFYATLNDTTAGHLYVVDAGAAICIGGVLGLGACATAAEEQAPTVAWLRYWACGDSNAERYFFGDGCALCSSPWAPPARKNFP